MISAPPHLLRRTTAFTVVEVLVFLLIIGMLCAILVPVGGVLRDHARGATCASNLGRVMSGMFVYADDHEGKFPPAMDSSRSTGPGADLPQAVNTWHTYLAGYVGLDENAVALHASGITWRSNSRERTPFSCPTSMTGLVGLPNFTGARLNPWFMYGLNADLPIHAGVSTDRRDGRNIGVGDLLYPGQTMAILETSDWSAVYSREIGDATGSGAALVPHGNAANVAFYDGSVRRIPTGELTSYPSNGVFWAGGFGN
jgi:prepilin-type processing-associated H-X9-DG protein